MGQERKIYRSFHDISPREYMYFPKGTIEASKPGRFSRLEIQHLLISMAVLTIAFAFVFTNNNIIYGLSYGFNLEILPKGILLSFFGIFTAFFFHELLHKFMAQKYGLWSEFRMYPRGLILSLLFAIFTGFVFSAPGAVMFRGETKKHEIGRIAIAGPMANIIISSISYIIYRFFLFDTSIGKFFGFIALINALLGSFNLIPFGPLDGIKVIRWNGLVWACLFIYSIVMIVLIFPIAVYI